MENSKLQFQLQENVYITKQTCSSDEQQQPQQTSDENKKFGNISGSNSKEDQQHFRQYMEFFEDVEEDVRDENIHFRQIQRQLGSFYPQLTIFNVQPSKTYEIVVMQVKLGSYVTKFKIINTKQKSPFHSCHMTGFGSFGDVYSIPTNTHKQNIYEKYVIKCFPLKLNAKENTCLRDIIKQLFLLRFTNEVLYKQSYNPDNFFCFDLIHYRNCIQFAMEKLSWDQTLAANRQRDLKKSLRTFHKLGLVHCDIKEDNVAYNKEHSMWVFIDFGLSLLVKQKQSQKSQTIFLGNFKNASPQMRKISKKPQGGLINLYYNDYHGLKNTFADLQTNRKDIKRKIDGLNVAYNENLMDKIEHFLLILKLKYYLYGLSIDNQIIYDLLMQFKQKNDSNMELILLEFISQIKLSVLCRLFYRELLIKKEASPQYVFYKSSQSYSLKNYKKFENEQMSQFQAKFATLMQKVSINLSLHFINQKIQETLFDQSLIITLDKELYFKNILEFISFTLNKHKRSIVQKNQVCSVFNKLFLKKPLQQSLSPLEKTVIYLLDYCTSTPFTSWKKNNLFNVLTQYFILGLGKNEKILEIIQFFQKNTKSLAQLVFTLYLLYQHFVWDHNILFKRENFQIRYLTLLVKLTNLTFELQTVYNQKHLKQYIFQRVEDSKPRQFQDSLQNDYLVITFFIVNLGIREKYQSCDLEFGKSLDKMLKLSSRDVFVATYGKQVFAILLNLGIKLTYSSCFEASVFFLDILMHFQSQQEIKYYYFSIIHTLRRIKDTKNVQDLLYKWKQIFKADQLCENTVMNQILVEQNSQSIFKSELTSIVVKKSLDLAKTSRFDRVRPVLNLFKSMQIFSYITLNMAEKQFISIKKYCRKNFYDFLKLYPTVINIPYLRDQLNQAHSQTCKYFRQFEKAMDWLTISYIVFLKKDLILSIYFFGKFLDVPFIMGGQKFFYLFLKASKVFIGPSQESCEQKMEQFFLDFLFTKLKKPEKVNQIVASYLELKSEFSPQLLEFAQKKSQEFSDEDWFFFISNIDIFLAQKIQSLNGITQAVYHSYILQIILKINISFLMMVRKYDTIGEHFPLRYLQGCLFRKCYHIYLQNNRLAAHKKQNLALYVQYLGNLYATFDFLIKRLKKQNIQVSEYQKQVNAVFTSKITSLKHVLSQTKSYCLIRYFNVAKIDDIFIFKVFLKNIMQIKDKKQLKLQVIELLNIMSLVYENKQSWRHFFIIKQLLQVDSNFTSQNFVDLITVLLQIKWKCITNECLLNNYKLVKFFNYLFCSLIDCLLTSTQNNRMYLLDSPLLYLTLFQFNLSDNAFILKLMKIEETLLEKLTLRDKIQLLPYLLMIAIYKAKEIQSYSARFYRYLQKKMIKFLVVNDWGNLFITYCKQYLSLCQKIHIHYFKNLYSKVKGQRCRKRKLLKQKIDKYFPVKTKELEEMVF